MNYAVGDGVVVVDHLGVLVDVIHQCVVVGHVGVAGEHDVCVVHVELRESTLADVGGEESTFFDNVRSCQRVACLRRDVVHVLVARALQVSADGVVGGCEERVGAVGGEHGEIWRALENGDELAKLLGVVLQEPCRSDFLRLVVVHGHVVVVVHAGDE